MHPVVLTGFSVDTATCLSSLSFSEQRQSHNLLFRWRRKFFDFRMERTDVRDTFFIYFFYFKGGVSAREASAIRISAACFLSSSSRPLCFLPPSMERLAAAVARASVFRAFQVAKCPRVDKMTRFLFFFSRGVWQAINALLYTNACTVSAPFHSQLY